jgi:hypothetical protein
MSTNGTLTLTWNVSSHPDSYMFESDVEVPPQHKIRVNMDIKLVSRYSEFHGLVKCIVKYDWDYVVLAITQDHREVHLSVPYKYMELDWARWMWWKITIIRNYFPEDPNTLPIIGDNTLNAYSLDIGGREEPCVVRHREETLRTTTEDSNVSNREEESIE